MSFERPWRLLTGTLALLLLSTSFAPAAFGADPFYEQRLREGTRAMERGQPEDAARHLRLAAFGFLTEADLLVESLVRLAQVQAALGDSAGFDQTFERITDVEQRWSWYSQAPLDDSLRQSFEQLVASRVPVDTLRRLPAFENLIREHLASDLDSLAPKQRRERLEQLIAEEPESDRWPLLLARLELEQKRPQRTIELAGTILTRTSDDQGALCVRGVAHSRQENCPAAVADLMRCERSTVDLPIAFALVNCLASLELWDEASAALEALPEAVRNDRSFNRLERRIERNVETTPSELEAPEAPQATVPALAPVANSGEMSPETAADASRDSGLRSNAEPVPAALEGTPTETPELSAEDEGVLARIQGMLDSARTAGDLDEPAALAADLANRYPSHSDLQLQTGEIFYRASRWPEAANYFRRGGFIPADRPGIAFYAAVAFYETGDQEAAANALRVALPLLKRSAFVESYIDRILGENTP